MVSARETGLEKMKVNYKDLRLATREREKKTQTPSKSNVKSFELCADEEKKKKMLKNIGQWCVVVVYGDVSTGWDFVRSERLEQP